MNTFDEFRHYLTEQGRGALTVAGYAEDLVLFARWYEHTNSEPLTPAALTLTDAREYRQHLLRHKAKASHDQSPPGCSEGLRRLGN